MAKNPNKKNKTTEDKKKRDLAFDNFYHGVYVFNQEVDTESVSKAKETLRAWYRLDLEKSKKRAIRFEILSDGGSVYDGLALYDALRMMSGAGHTIRTVITGLSASMGGVIAQAGDVRAIGKESFLHMHESSRFVIGDYSTSQMVTYAACSKLATRHIAELLSRRSHLTAKEVEEMFRDDSEILLSAEDALHYGFVDVIE